MRTALMSGRLGGKRRPREKKALQNPAAYLIRVEGFR